MSEEIFSAYLSGRRKRLLIVDDSRTIRTQLRALLRPQGFEIFEAEDGERALHLLDQQDIPTIISDWEMPVLDGLGFCRALREKYGFERHYIIMLTANDSRDAIKALFDAGGDDYLAKPIDRIALFARLKGGLRITTSRDDLHWVNAELVARERALKDAYAKLQEDLVVAEMVQRRYLPDPYTALPGIAFASHYEPAFHTSGDIFNYVRISPSEFCFFSVDVSGHGVASALLAVTVAETLCVQGKPQAITITKTADGIEARDPHDVVRELNTRFLDGETDHYFTITYAVINIDRRTLRFCQAGHPSLILSHADGTHALLGDGGPPVGMLNDIAFETNEIRLAKGDRVFLYSDGLSEAENPDQEQFGETRMLNLIAGSASEPLPDAIAGVVHAARAWQARKDFKDDISIVGIELSQ